MIPPITKLTEKVKILINYDARKQCDECNSNRKENGICQINNVQNMICTYK
jgi:hypothetical protein